MLLHPSGRFFITHVWCPTAVAGLHICKSWPYDLQAGCFWRSGTLRIPYSAYHNTVWLSLLHVSAAGLSPLCWFPQGSVEAVEILHFLTVRLNPLSNRPSKSNSPPKCFLPQTMHVTFSSFFRDCVGTIVCAFSVFPCSRRYSANRFSQGVHIFAVM